MAKLNAKIAGTGYKAGRYTDSLDLFEVRESYRRQHDGRLTSTAVARLPTEALARKWLAQYNAAGHDEQRAMQLAMKWAEQDWSKGNAKYPWPPEWGK